jgi:tetratricopeptide (TPR) repeat protein
MNNNPTTGLKQRPGVSAPAQPAPLFAQGLALHQAGRLAEAARIYAQILSAAPDHFDSQQLLGVIFLQCGHPNDALRHIDAALKINPDNVHVLSNRGAALKELGRLDEALATYDRALALRPDYAEAHSNRGSVLHDLRRHDDALASYDRALALRTDYADALCNRAAALHELRRHEAALESCDRAIALQPDYAEAHSNRGNTLGALSRFDEALASCDRALALRPTFAEAYCNRGNILCEINRSDEALANYDRAIALRPAFAEAYSNRGNALHELRRFEDALVSYDRALALRPDSAEAHLNRGNALKELRQFDEALASYRRAQELRPDLADAHFSEALCRLLIGDFAAGWEKQEWRWQTSQLSAAKRNFRQPQWTGADDIAGKTILLHAEQGFGDTLQFCRYVPSVAERAARVILEVQKPLYELTRTLPAQIIWRGQELPDFDLHCPLLSLPLAFGTRLETIPARTPYLSAPDSAVAAWRDRLGERRPRIGVVWAGDPRKKLPGANRIDRQRSLQFDQLAPVLQVGGCEFYSLQKGDDAVAQLRNSRLHDRVIDWTADFHDFSDTAAFIENLDLVIAVDTAVAHLAGALGKPLWLINRHNTCWRWLLGRDDSPWYPTVRQFRQDATRQWEPVVSRIAATLADYVAGFDAAERGFDRAHAHSNGAPHLSGAGSPRPQ